MKLVRIPSLLLVGLSVLLLSCEKEEPFTEIDGKVYEYGTFKPIANAELRFEWWDPGIYGKERYIVDTTLSDARGNYLLTGDVPEDQEYYAIAEAPQYFNTERVKGLEQNVNRGVHQTVNIPLIPYAWIRMHISITGTYHRMSINPIQGEFEGHQILAYSDTTIISDHVLGNMEVAINQFKYKCSCPPDVETVYVQTIGHDTVDVYLTL